MHDKENIIFELDYRINPHRVIITKIHYHCNHSIKKHLLSKRIDNRLVYARIRR